MEMAQPNVAREPSMEEILASIRRIIESNEPATDQSMAQPTNYSDDELDEAEAPICRLERIARGARSASYS